MSEVFDPYYKWLGIKPKDQPPNHYRLLGIDLFEIDPDVIVNAADQRITHVRTYQLGKHVAVSQRILNELAAARVCLLNPQEKASYDAKLRQEMERVAVETSSPAPTFPVEPIVVPPINEAHPPRIRTTKKPWRKTHPVETALVGIAVVVLAVVLSLFFAGSVEKPRKSQLATEALPQESPEPENPEVASAQPVSVAKPKTPGFQTTPPKMPVEMTAESKNTASLPDTRQEREVADWVLRSNGTLTVVTTSGHHVTVKVASDLPADFVIKAIDLVKNQSDLDVEFHRLRGLRGLQHLNLRETRIGDAGLVHLKSLPSLSELWLECTRVTDLGLQHLASIPSLRYVNLRDTQITDAGLVALGGSSLEGIGLDATMITDDGLRTLTSMPFLRSLDLRNTRTTDAGLEHIRQMKSLHALHPSNRMTTQGIQDVCKALPSLQIYDAPHLTKQRP